MFYLKEVMAGEKSLIRFPEMDAKQSMIFVIGHLGTKKWVKV